MDEHPQDADTWARQIIAIGKPKTVQASVAIGNLLRAAKTALAPAEWERLNTGLIPMHRTTISRYIRIAKHPIVGNLRYADKLPPGWFVLQMLTGIAPTALLQAIHDGKVTPALTRHQVETFLLPAKYAPVVETPPVPQGRSPADKQVRLTRIREEAARGATSHQIAAMLGISPEHCRMLIKQEGIACPGDRVEGKRRQLRTADLIESLAQVPISVMDVEHLLDYQAIPPEQLDADIATIQLTKGQVSRAFNLILARLLREKSRKEKGPHV